jgi:hypothetical protein
MTRRVTVAPARLAGWLQGFTGRHGETSVHLSGDVVQLSGSDAATARIEVPFPPLAGSGAASGFGSGVKGVALDPLTPEPLLEGALLEVLVAHVTRSRRVGVLLVRKGGYASGVFDGADLLASKVGTSYVQGTTKAGGWSQQRYARRRANQASAAYAHAADTAVRVLLPETGRLDALVTGGDRAAIEATLADPRLEPLRALRVASVLTVADPRLAVLKATPEQFLAIRITLDP